MIAEARRRITRDTLRTTSAAVLEGVVSATFVELEAEARADAPEGVVVQGLMAEAWEDAETGDVVLRVTGRW